MLVNGVLGDSISAADRGLLYGDGVFRTLRVMGGQPLLWQRHYRKLQQDCASLNLPCPDAPLLLEELQRLIGGQTDGVAKIIITRGAGARGYAPARQSTPTRILSLTPFAPYPDEFYTQGIKLRVCNLRLAHQPQLAGIKHLNRLENVLAAAEWNDVGIAEGLLLDMGGNVIEGTRSNLFLVRGGALLTPELSRCGVAGIQRERVLEWAAAHGVPCRIAQFGLKELLAADELFLVNSIIGLWPVRELQDRAWSRFPVALQVQKWLTHASG
ncbi:MAG: aminodeoxychorismate lyase [Nitrosomonadales bacterium]|nr:aminodeoxychorismate lyase [Nitrosomonadales bacterium]